MEIEKVIRIVATFVALVAFAVWAATEIFFPGSCRFARIPQLIVLVYSFWMIWRGTAKNQKENSK